MPGATDKENRVADKIDAFLAEGDAHPEQIDSFFALVQSNYAEAIRTASSYFLWMLAAWLLTYAIATGVIDKIELLGIGLDPKMIVVSPFLIGLLTYGLLSALAGAVVLWEAVSRRVYKLSPTAWHASLDDLLAPPTFSNVERMLEPGRKNWVQLILSHGWFALVALMMFGGSLTALVHTTCLFLDAQSGKPGILGVASVTLGALAWLRGIVLFVAAIKATGGLTLGHHRGSGRAGVGADPALKPRKGEE
jgi:hypothetical protein